MKQLFIFSLALCMCSCSVVKKFKNKTQTNTDSASTKTSNVTHVTSTDSTGKETTQATEKQKIESGYKKTTSTIVEWFSDEFGEGDSTSSVGPQDKAATSAEDTTKRNAPPGQRSKGKTDGKLYKRRTTTIEEEGFKNALNEAAMLNEKTGQIQNDDSFSEDHKDQANKTTKQETNQSSKFSFSLIPFWLCLVLIVVIGVGLYVKIKYF